VRRPIVAGVGQALELVVGGAARGPSAHIVLPVADAERLQEVARAGFHLGDKLCAALSAEPGIRRRGAG